MANGGPQDVSIRRGPAAMLRGWSSAQRESTALKQETYIFAF